jgi:hypothetical protein
MAGTEGCADCHEEPEPQAQLAGIAHFTECATCHGNHAVMRPAITMLNGKIQDVNKVGKFSKMTAGAWTFPIVLNPDIASLDDGDVVFVDIDPATAEASDE